MFIFVFWAFLGTFLPHTMGHDGYWLAGQTRERKKSCYGDLRPLNDALARAAGTPPSTKVCLRHWRSIEKDDNRCLSTLSETHSPKLTAIPRGLYKYIDKHEENTKKYHPGSKCCYKCRIIDISVKEAQRLYRVEKEKCEELKEELTAVQSQLSRDTRFP